METTTQPKYTHVGCRPRVGYQHSGRNFDHYIEPAGKNHAVTRDPVWGRWQAMCGKVVPHVCRDQWGDEVTDHVEPATADDGAGVTCKACRRVLGLK